VHWMQRRFRKTWEPRLGPEGVDEALRYGRFMRRASLPTMVGAAVFCIGVGAPSVPALCVGAAMLAGGFYLLFGPARRAQKRAIAAAAEFQGIDASLSGWLTLRDPGTFDVACRRARRMQDLRRERESRRPTT